MDNGVNFAFDSSQHDFASFGVAPWQDGWHQVIIVGTKPMALADPNKGGRMVFEIKNVDPQSPDNGKTHFISLNVYHNDPATKQRAENELASICWVTNTFRFNSTAELYNKPFYVLAQLQTSKPTPAYPNPTPQTNFRGYRNLAGQEPSKQGQASQPQQAPQFAQQPQQQQPAFQQPQPAFQQPQQAQPAPAFQPQPQAQPQPQFQQPQQQPQPAFAPQQQQQPMPQQQPQQAWAPQQGQPQQAPQQAFAPQQGGGTPPWGQQ